MEEMTRQERAIFMFNQGVRYAAVRYYKGDAQIAFDTLKSFKPFTRLNIGNEGEVRTDFPNFKLGFDSIQNRYNEIDKLKLKAEASLKNALACFEFMQVSKAKTVEELTKLENLI